jgi:hypothetical protein
MIRDNVPPRLIELLQELDLYGNVAWQSYDQDSRRAPTRDLDEAQAASSQINGDEGHYLLLDLDLPAWLVPSSTPGHSHLYVETDKPIQWQHLKKALIALALCGVLEDGYVMASLDRESTTLRLPWVHKAVTPVPPWREPDSALPPSAKELF